MELKFQNRIMKILSDNLNNDNNIDVLLMRYRVKNSLKQKDMAKLLGCTQSQYSLWENGLSPSRLRDKMIRELLK